MGKEILHSTTAGSYHPHFFQPLLSEFRRRFRIPKYFMKTYLEKELSKRKRRRGARECESSKSTLPVVLRSHNRKWVVHLKGRIIEKGWGKFIDQYYDHDDFDEYGHSKKMDVGDILVFRHMGKLVFDVFVFDPSTSFQKVPNYHSNVDDKNTKKRKNTATDHHDDAQTQSRVLNRSNDFKKRKMTMISPQEEQCSKPYFDTKFKNINLRKKMLYVPKSFVEEIGGLEGKDELILKDDRGRRWEVEARFYTTRSTYTRSTVYITKGWKAFQIGNGLKLGDCFRFQLLKNGQRPVLLFSRLPRKNMV